MTHRARIDRATLGLLEKEAGFSLPELLIATAILLIISGAVTNGILQMTTSQATISNRTEMHSGVRSATELMQQEIGQAGRVSLPGTTSLGGNVAIGNGQTVGINMNIASATAAAACGIAANTVVASVCDLFAGEAITIDAGANQETVVLTAVDTVGLTITANFTLAHANGAAVNVYGAFATGVVPDTRADGTSYPNGSSATKLKLYGDINGDGNLVYVEYFCDAVGGNPGSGNLYRTVLPYNAASKPAPGAPQILLSNIQPNPNATPCFSYLPRVTTAPQHLAEALPITDPAAGVASSTTFVLDVAITLTVNTQQNDPITGKPQTETKALLNVSPRNVFDVWQAASADPVANDNPSTIPNRLRVQPMPPNIQTVLLP